MNERERERERMFQIRERERERMRKRAEPAGIDTILQQQPYNSSHSGSVSNSFTGTLFLFPSVVKVDVRPLIHRVSV